MTTLGTPLSPGATKILFLGAGELGKEVVIEFQRLGCEVIACDRYANAPGMQVAHRSHRLLHPLRNMQSPPPPPCPLALPSSRRRMPR